MQIFEAVLIFKLRTTQKQKNQTVYSTYLVSIGCGRLAEGKEHETDCFNLLCVGIFFSEPWQSAQFQIFFDFFNTFDLKHCLMLIESKQRTLFGNP